MKSQEFRSYMIDRIREFDKWAWKDEADSPEDYENMTKELWFELFMGFNGND